MKVQSVGLRFPRVKNLIRNDKLLPLKDLFYNNTIVAISTPPGRGGIGVVRLSGAESLTCARELLEDASFRPNPHQAYLKKFYDPVTGELIDQGLLLYFKAPRSYTGEDVVELSGHGSPVLLSRIVDVLLRVGARAAGHGEFTMRALANKRLNLSQAEAVRDLINAQTNIAATQAVRQLSGELSARLHPVKEALISIIVPLESAVEFVEEDVPQVYFEEVKRRLHELVNKTQQLASTYNIGRTLGDGYKVVLIGRPNVGKSSIFNMLLAYERSIVTDVPGTTRDSLSEYISINDFPVLLTDTAGVRSATDQVERLGIERTQRAIADADLVLAVFDDSAPLLAEDHQVLALLNGSKHVNVVNKVDASNSLVGVDLSTLSLSRVIRVSAKTGSGLDALKEVIAASLSESIGVAGQDYLITNARHYDLLNCTITSLRDTINLIERRAGEEILLVGLYNALRYLGDITGETIGDDVLGEIFATFCIGK